MAERKRLVIPEKIRDKYKGKPIWSYSRLSTFHNCTHEYFLGRILKKAGSDNIYGLAGSVSHDILEEFYSGTIMYGDMANKFEQDFLDIEVSDFKFCSDADKNKKMMNEYRTDIIHFFKNHIKVPYKVLCEKEIWIEVDNNLFIGYVDAIHKENGIYVITDYKTSSISEFQGDKLLDKQQQLLLYALGLNQLGIPLENIMIRWNFLKYTSVFIKHMVNVTYVEKGKQKTSCVRRGEWVSKVKTQLKKDIVAHYEKQLITFKAKELKEMVDKCVESNSLDSLPVGIQEQYILTDVYKMGRRNKWVSESPVQTQLRKDLKDIGLEAVEIEMLLVECASKNSLEPLIEHLDIENYVLEDHYIYGEVNQENVDKLIADFAKDIEAIIAKGTEEDNWQREPIGDSQSFYCNVLCGYKKYCKYYTDYRKQITEYTSENFTSNDDLLNELENL